MRYSPPVTLRVSIHKVKKDILSIFAKTQKDLPD